MRRGQTRQLPQEAEVQVPIYAAVLSAGPGGEPSDRIVGYGSFLKQWLRREAGIDPARAFMAEVRGYSMIPLFNDRDLVLGELAEEISGNGIYAMQWRGDVLVKHVENGSDALRLISENDAFGTETIQPEDAHDFRVIGRVMRKVTRPY